MNVLLNISLIIGALIGLGSHQKGTDKINQVLKTSQFKPEFPIQFERREISQDSTYVLVNNSDIDVFLLFNGYKEVKGHVVGTRNRLNLHTILFRDFDICLTSGNQINFASQLFINFKGSSSRNFIKDSINTISDSIISCHEMLKSYNLSKMQGYSESQEMLTSYHPKLDSSKMRCTDTNKNWITFQTEKGVLKLKYTLNTRMVEADLNKDGQPELYLFSYQTCAGQVRIYQLIQEAG